MKTKFVRRAVLALSVAVLAAGVLPLQAAAQAAKKELVIGATAGSNIDQLKAGIVPALEKKGYKVKLVEFNDYVQPNQALAQGSLDANFFQHRVYLQKFAADQKLEGPDVHEPLAPDHAGAVTSPHRHFGIDGRRSPPALPECGAQGSGGPAWCPLGCAWHLSRLARGKRQIRGS